MLGLPVQFEGELTLNRDSAFDLTRSPTWGPLSFLEAIPELKEFNETTLVRVGIEGAFFPRHPPTLARSDVRCGYIYPQPGTTISCGGSRLISRRL